MTGWKTWAAGLASILGGVAAILTVISSGDFNFEAIQGGIAMIALGLGMIGIGHKVEKASSLKG